MPRSTFIPMAAALGGLLLSGCGSTTVAASSDPTATALRNRVPEAIRKAGVLKIATNLNYAPVDFRTPDGVPAGLDPELANALAAYLGLKVEYQDLPFASVIPAVQTKKADLAMSAINDTKQRQDGNDNTVENAGGVDFIDYLMTGTSILVKQGNPANISSLDSLCGHTVALQGGTIQDQVAHRQTGACTKAGKPLQIHSLNTDAQALAEVASGTAVADLNDFPVAEYNTTSSSSIGSFQLVGDSSQTVPYGITLDKDSKDLEYALGKALDQLILNGQYDKILAKWNVTSGAVPSAVINGGL